MPAYLHALATAVPDTAYEQAFIGELMAAQHADDRRLSRLIARLYRHSGIDKRHSVIADFVPGAPAGLFFDPETQRVKVPGTAARNALYAQTSKPLFSCASSRALAASPFGPAEVTHVITASCTGFFAPGPDVALVRELGLKASAARYHLGFMGCYAALPALKLARDICLADAEAVVLVVCVELCTLHLTFESDEDSLLASSLFADGGAAAVVSAKGEGVLELSYFGSALTSGGEEAMAWTIGDQGFAMTLSSYVPRLLESELAPATAPLFAQAGVAREKIDHWAVHPGGRAILDKVASALGLADKAMAPSRRVLREYGNMSSPSVLFVLREVLENGAASGERVAALAFGPGLTIEGGLFRVP
jgi:predicted naringenin-chalcone synthase